MDGRNAIWSDLFLRESELRQMALIPTRNEGHLARRKAAGHPFPRARPVIQGAVANGCALVICAARASLVLGEQIEWMDGQAKVPSTGEKSSAVRNL
jgi:hypothetical protein